MKKSKGSILLLVLGIMVLVIVLSFALTDIALRNVNKTSKTIANEQAYLITKDVLHGYVEELNKDLTRADLKAIEDKVCKVNPTALTAKTDTIKFQGNEYVVNFDFDCKKTTRDVTIYIKASTKTEFGYGELTASFNRLLHEGGSGNDDITGGDIAKAIEDYIANGVHSDLNGGNKFKLDEGNGTGICVSFPKPDKGSGASSSISGGTINSHIYNFQGEVSIGNTTEFNGQIYKKGESVVGENKYPGHMEFVFNQDMIDELKNIAKKHGYPHSNATEMQAFTELCFIRRINPGDGKIPVDLAYSDLICGEVDPKKIALWQEIDANYLFEHVPKIIDLGLYFEKYNQAYNHQLTITKDFNGVIFAPTFKLFADKKEINGQVLGYSVHFTNVDFNDVLFDGKKDEDFGFGEYH